MRRRICGCLCLLCLCWITLQAQAGRRKVMENPGFVLTNTEDLEIRRIVLTDEQTQQEGITLAAILLFGKDNTIMSVLPQHKTDAIFRVFNVDRYDDRDVIITNLLESYDRLIAFGEKHLNDLFTMDGMISVSARDKILREIISNLLVHRDFSSGYVAKFVIERTRIYTENANLSHGQGVLELASFEPFQKNPPISKIFREIGLADELGSGMRNTYKYTRLYSGSEPEFVEGDIFRTIVPLKGAATATVGPVSSEIGKEEKDDIALFAILLYQLFCNLLDSNNAFYMMILMIRIGFKDGLDRLFESRHFYIIEQFAPYPYSVYSAMGSGYDSNEDFDENKKVFLSEMKHYTNFCTSSEELINIFTGKRNDVELADRNVVLKYLQDIGIGN